VVTTAIAAASYRLLLFPQTIPHNPQRNAANFPVAHPFFLLAVIALVKQVRFISNLAIHVVAACNGDVGFKDRRSETVFSGRRLRSQGCARRKPFVKPIKTVKCAARPVLGLRFRFCAGCLQHCVAVGAGAAAATLLSTPYTGESRLPAYDVASCCVLARSIATD
jgi:hypothetical protein